MGDKPTHRFIRKNATGKWETVGAAWERDNGNGYSVVFEPVRGGEKTKCLMVKNEPKPEGLPASQPSPMPTNDEDQEIPF